MKLDNIAWLVLLLATGPLVSGEDQSNSNDTVIIQTQLQNYEQPSLRDYEECQANRRKCMGVCSDNEKCQKECPLCPVLLVEPLVLHGINDTTYVPPPQQPLNTTNIIRLTNEINNIIKNDIKGRSEINVQVNQSVSQAGGRFGLGFNEQGSCCYVVQRQRDCEHLDNCQEFSRHRVCGARCQSRVMHAKRVVICEKDRPDVCQETVEYVPARRHKSKTKRRHHSNLQTQDQAPDCKSVNFWPYVLCGQSRENFRRRRAACQSCLEVSYGYVLQNGLPAECIGCFPSMMTAPILYPGIWNPSFGLSYPAHLRPGENNQDIEQEQEELDIQNINPDTDDKGDWILKSEECLGPNGEILDCKDVDLETSLQPSPPTHLEQGNNDPDEGSGEDFYKVPAQRRRRRHGKFLRSIYSHRTDN